MSYRAGPAWIERNSKLSPSPMPVPTKATSHAHLHGSKARSASRLFCEAPRTAAESSAERPLLLLRVDSDPSPFSGLGEPGGSAAPPSGLNCDAGVVRLFDAVELARDML